MSINTKELTKNKSMKMTDEEVSTAVGDLVLKNILTDFDNLIINADSLSELDRKELIKFLSARLTVKKESINVKQNQDEAKEKAKLLISNCTKKIELSLKRPCLLKISEIEASNDQITQIIKNYKSETDYLEEKTEDLIN